MKQIKYCDILISSFENIADRTPERVSVAEVAERFKNGYYKGPVEAVRNASTVERRNRLKKMLPAVTFCGVFRDGHSIDMLMRKTGLACIDIDYKDNPDVDFDDLRADLCENKHVAICAKSSGGKGLFVVMPLAYPDDFAEQVEAIFRLFAGSGIKCDEQCKDITRLRFVTYDPELYLNPAPVPFPLRYYPECDRHSNRQVETDKGAAIPGEHVKTVLRAVDEIELLEKYRVDLAPRYDDWLKLAFAFATTFGEEGRELYLRICRLCPAHDEEQSNAKFDEAIRHGRGDVSIGTFFDMVEKNDRAKAAKAREDFAGIDSPKINYDEYEDISDDDL